MKNRRNYYRVLQVQPDAPVEIIRASYKTLMRELKQHPDLGGDLWNAQVINQAYDTLSDPQKRLQYDKQLFEQYTKQPFRHPLTDRPPAITLFCPFCKRPLARKAAADECCPTCRSPLQSIDEKNLGQACRRSLPRIKKSGRFYYYTTWPQKSKEGKLVDLSKDGMRFICWEQLTLGTLLKISSTYLRGVAKISNTHKIHHDGAKTYSVGAEFISVTFKEPRGGFYSSTA